MTPAAKRITRRALASVGLVFLVAALVVGNMPDSALQAAVGRVTQPFLDAAGLYQGWGVFAEPRNVSAYVDARVDYSDGTSSVYPIPVRHGLGAYADYRWQKYEEVIRPDDGRQQWPAYANYVAGLAAKDGKTPVRVTLVRRWSPTLPPGPGPERGPWQQVVMASFPVPVPQ
jgi:hypothetical protein